MHEHREGEVVVIAGHPRWCRSLLRAAGRDRERLSDVVGSDEARDHWLGDNAPGGPIDWIARGDWRRALQESLRKPPADPGERSAIARAFVGIGRFEAALALVERSRRTEDILIRLKGLVRMGRMAAARRTLTALEGRRLNGAAKLEECEEAIRIHAAAGRAAQLRAWAKQALEAAVGPHAARGRALAFLAMREVDGAVEAASLAEPEGEPADWTSCLALARFAMDGGRFQVADEALGTALRRFRRDLPVYDRASLWNELATHRLSVDDWAGAERAARVSVKLFRGCDGPAGRAGAHGNLAEARIRTGHLSGVRETIDSLRRVSLMAGSAAGIVDVRQLEARLDLAEGRWSSALESCGSALEELRKRQLGGGRERALRVLSGRALVHLGRRKEARKELQAAVRLPAADRSAGVRGGCDTLAATLLLVGLREEARAMAAGSACRGPWAAVSEDRAPDSADWQRLEEQGTYHRALAIHDLVCLGVENTPARLLESAVDTLAEAGAETLAQRVDAARRGPWRALRAFLDAEEFTSEAFHTLLASAGHPEARIAVHESRDAGGREESTEVLLAGPGGSEQFSVGVPAGRLVLSADGIEEPTRALLTVIAGRTPAAFGRRRETLEVAEARGSAAPRLIGRNELLLAARERIAKLALHDLPVLILGESGTGKELFARWLHDSSARASGPWQAVNCAALPEGLVMSDLFGHRRGSFTGADRDRIGVFESGEGGTVFLDEIAELPLAAQAMLLRALQEGEIRRVGESRPRHVDFRLVSATHRDLSAMVEAGEFREDLYYRLGVATVEAPALRDRDGDIMLLAHHFLGLFTGDEETQRFSENARRRLLEYPWPGNVRELRNVIESAAALAEGSEITVGMLGLPKVPRRPAQVEGASYHWKLEQYRRSLIRKALEDAGGNQARAARALGMSRQALSYLVRKQNYAL
jgi:DNA-binding NtrC family response regulator